MRILVTGISGFIGTHLAERLLKEGHEVIGWDNFSICNKKCESYLNELNINYLYLTLKDVDISNWDDIKKQIYPDNTFDLIYHLASQPRIQPSFSNPKGTLFNNILGTINILDFSRINNGIPVILAGSSSCTADYFGNPYSFSKHSQEELCQMYQRTFGVPCCITRFYNVYGPRHTCDGDYATVIAIFEKQFKEGKPLTVVGDGSQQRSFTHVDNIVDGLIKVSRKPELFDCKIINLGYNQVWSILEAARMFNSPIEFLPERKGEAQITEFKSTNDLDWFAEINIKDYIEDFIENNKHMV